MVVYGSKVSYFTGKFETYLRYKRISYDFRVLDARHYLWVVPRALGASQLPSVRLEDGRWMSDTTPMIAWLEARHPEPAVIPEDPLTRYIALLIEDYADEWLWRPAMYYRWSYEPDRRMAARHLAIEIMNLPLPLSLRRINMTRRQRRLFVQGDGIDRHSRVHAERTFARILELLQSIFGQRPFVLGERPTIADVGLMGPFWRHFVHDPTPAAIMQERTPAVFEWAARMWNAAPAKPADGARVNVLPEDLAPLLREIGETHLQALAANAAAHAGGRPVHELPVQGTTYHEVPTSAYRVWCLEQLRRRFEELEQPDSEQVREMLQANGCWEPLWRVQRLHSGHDPGGEAPFCRVSRMVRDRPRGWPIAR